MEHVISAYYDLTHGVGLAILTPAWMKYVLNENTKGRFARFAREVWYVKEADEMKAALMGIEKTAEFFKRLGMPSTFSEVGIDDSKFEEMASEAVRTSGISSRAYVKLEKEDVLEILRGCR